MDEPIIESSGNVFADLDLEPAEAAILHMRAKLMTYLRLYMYTLEARAGRQQRLN
jgi:predicted XRE-type DNA-binding protein